MRNKRIIIGYFVAIGVIMQLALFAGCSNSPTQATAAPGSSVKFPYEKAKQFALSGYLSVIGYRDEGNGSITMFLQRKDEPKWKVEKQFLLLTTENGAKWFFVDSDRCIMID
jgi:hypothetical protein